MGTNPTKTDPQTKTAKREHFLRRLSAELEAARTEGTPLSLLMVSIDELDTVSKTASQAVVDRVLHQAARLIEGAMRSRDFVARYSEDTFAVIIPDTTAETAGAIGVKLRGLIGSSELGDIDDPVSVTVSIGVANRAAGARLSSIELVNTALENRTAARGLGGNRIVGSKPRGRLAPRIDPPALARS